MPEQVDVAGYAAAAIELLLFSSGVVLLAKQTAREWGKPSEHLNAWKVSISDFILWLCVIVFAIAIGATAFGYLAHIDPKAKLSELDAFLIGCSEQVAVLVVQLALLRTRSLLAPIPDIREKMPLGKIFSRGALAFVAAYPLIVITSLTWNYLLELFTKSSLPEQTAVHLVEHESNVWFMVVTLLFTVAVAPVNEELFFRAGIYRFLKGKFSRRVALGVMSLCFATAHFNVLEFAPLFVLGWLLARAYERSGHIGVPIVFHALFNLSTIVILLLTRGY